MSDEKKENCSRAVPMAVDRLQPRRRGDVLRRPGELCTEFARSFFAYPFQKSRGGEAASVADDILVVSCAIKQKSEPIVVELSDSE
jgi:hypothetical protein